MLKFTVRAKLIEDQIRAKRADLIGCREFVHSDDTRPMDTVARSMGHDIARLMTQKASLTGMPSMRTHVMPDDPFAPRFDGDMYEALVVAVHPDLWFQITALLRDLRDNSFQASVTNGASISGVVLKGQGET